MASYASIVDLIGNTPIIEVSELSPNQDVKIYAKLEGQNPAGSVKDRIAKAMILSAEREGKLTSGSHTRAIVRKYRNCTSDDFFNTGLSPKNRSSR